MTSTVSDLSLQPSIAPNIVLIDAISRSGKAIFSDLIPSLTKMEHIQFCTELELISQGLLLGGISQEYARAFVRIYLNERSYNLQLSRNVNFRSKDQTGVPNYKCPETYFERLSRDDGDWIVPICSSEDVVIPINTHELLANFRHFKNLDVNFRMISLWRNPIDVIYSWINRGWDHRFHENDPRSFSFNLRRGDKILPWYFALPTLKGTNVEGAELCANAVFALIESARTNYLMVDPSQILLVTYEDICMQTDRELKKICAFLEVEKTEYTEIAKKKARLPQPITDTERLDKLKFLESRLKTSTLEKLSDLHLSYERDLYGMRELTDADIGDLNA